MLRFFCEPINELDGNTRFNFLEAQRGGWGYIWHLAGPGAPRGQGQQLERHLQASKNASGASLGLIQQSNARRAQKIVTHLKQFGSKSIFLADTNDEDGLSSTWVEFSAIIVKTEQRFNEFEQNGSQRLIKRSVGDRTIGKTLPTKIITSNEAATVTDR